MPYTHSRLLEALKVIRDDDAHRDALNAEILARTQYRDDFHFRQSTAIHANQVILPCNVDTSDDDDYNPSAWRRRRKAYRDEDHGSDEYKTKRSKGSSKRKHSSFNTPSTNSEHGGSTPSKKKKLHHSRDAQAYSEPGHAAFLSLKFDTDKGRTFLADKLKEYKDTNIDIYNIKRLELLERDPSRWRFEGGDIKEYAEGLDAAIDTRHAQRELEALGLDTLTLDSTRKLRSGKVRAELKSQKRKSDDVEHEGDGTDNHTSRNSKQAKVDSELGSIVVVEEEEEADDTLYHNVVTRAECQFQFEPVNSTIPHSGASIYDAISLDSSSDEDDIATTPNSTPQSIGRKSSSATTITTISDDIPPSQLPRTPFSTSKLTINNSKPHAMPLSPISTPQTRITTQTTCFSHPINFKSPNPATCTFHTDYRHAILGHGPITGQYLIFSNTPSQLIEIDSGHNANNIPSDTMCVSCALDYLQMIRCTRHMFRQLERYASVPGEVYVQDMFTLLRRGHPDRNTTSLMKTCSLCPAPAVWGCCVPQSRNKVLRPCLMPGETVAAARIRMALEMPLEESMMVKDTEFQPPEIGCGLVLCTMCYNVVDSLCDGRMAGNRTTILRKVRSAPLGARADVEFLFHGGLPWKAYHVDRPDVGA